jgi:hypothetical protein
MRRAMSRGRMRSMSSTTSSTRLGFLLASFAEPMWSGEGTSVLALFVKAGMDDRHDR